MESVMHEDIVIVGAGLAGLSTALGLHRLGIRSLVLEWSESLRNTGFALTMWTNAWRALDAVGVGDILREKSLQIQGFQVSSWNSSLPSSVKAPEADLKPEKFESRCLRRKDLLETLERELPQGAIRYSSKIVSIEESGIFKLVHLSDGSVFRAKVVIGCDGVNSMVAKWLGLENPVSAGRSAIRGFVVYPNGHGFEPKFHAYFGAGLRCGFMPCSDKSLYWFCTFNPSLFNYDDNEHNPPENKAICVKQYREMHRTHTRYGGENYTRLHLPSRRILTLEDKIVLARCLAEALLIGNKKDEEDYVKMERESDGKVMSFLKKKFLSKYTMGALVTMVTLIVTS
ncbi:hypothetical protein DH2020_047332 [Rehmannia glutinosa]|uniref:FAD-binding domain-containing protein n=1 Tax=Rehmannia glutinosa TaxID=99300 RepID=A0ABR0U8V4_REHGL